METEAALALESGAEAAALPVEDAFPGVFCVPLAVAGPAALDSLLSNSLTKPEKFLHFIKHSNLLQKNVLPCCARGAGSTPLLVNLSATEAKHLKAPSATWESSCRNKVLSAETHVGSSASAGSNLVHNLDTTAIAECKVSLCTR